MSDVNQTPEAPVTPLPRAGRGLKIALAISVALNLAVVGLVAGVALHGPPGGRADMVREMGFGPFEGALSDADRDALRKTVRDRFGDIRAARRQMQADSEALLAALKADPFVPEALTQAMATQAGHLAERLQFGSDVMRDYLLALSDDERRAFAERLEDRMKHGRDSGGRDGGGRDGD